MLNEIEVRRAKDADMPFIYANWLNHYKNYSSFAKRIRKDLFMQWHHKVVKLIVERSTCDVYVAYPKGDPEVLLGYLVTEQWPDGPVVHFIFVKEAFRRFGIARSMIKHSEIPTDKITFTHWTYDMDALTKRYPEYVYNPYKI